MVVKKKDLLKRQFNEFWEIKCPKCHETIELEVLINEFREKVGSKK